MDAIYYMSGFGILFLLVAIVTGLVKPSLLQKFLRQHATRPRIVIGGIVVFFILGSILSATEPSSVKQARQEAEAQKNAHTEQQAPQVTSEKTTVEEPTVETKDIEERKSVPFTEETKNDSSLAKGQRKTVQEGKTGEKILVYSVTYTDGKETGRVLKSESTTIPPMTKITSIGTYVAPLATTPKTTPAPATQSSVYYQNCTAVRAAGAAPIYRGQPGYASHLDRDDDGVGCE